jgi:hypothetical protein
MRGSRYSGKVAGTRGSQQMPYGKGSAVLISVQGIEARDTEMRLLERHLEPTVPDWGMSAES